MRVGVFLFGAVEMGDTLGSSGPPPTGRRYGQADFFRATERILDTGVLADRLGYDAFWLTEHHFQHEGYEVVPNGILIGAFLAERTRRIEIGTMFNVVGQWHPLRLAEDFATLHNLSGGRAVLGLGRGTVPREIEPLSLGRMSIGSYDNPDAVAADARNREVTDEAIDLLLAALGNETFCHRGHYFQAPPPGIPDRGGEVETLTLVPRPVYPYQVWQAITSPGSLEAVPARGFGGVFWLLNDQLLARRWERYAQVYEQSHGRPLAPGENRNLVINVCVGDTREQAMELLRPGHDEFWRFLGPYGWARGYRHPGGDAGPPPPGWVPTLEDSVAQRVWLAGTADDVAETLTSLADQLGLADITIFPSMPGESYDRAAEQLQRFAEQVRPQLTGAGGGQPLAAVPTPAAGSA